MEQNRNSFAPEAATDEPASPVNDNSCPPAEEHAAAESAELQFASQAEEDAYWKGLIAGLRDAGREPAHPHMPVDFDLDLTRDGASPSLVSGKLLEAAPTDESLLPARLPDRHDGFTPEKRRIFLATLAACGVVSDACRMARISRVAAYNFRNRAEGRAFAIAWNAALLISRARLSDEAHSRAMCGVVDRVYRNGELVAERHRYDNRLTMAVLTRLDRQAEGLGEGAATARIVAQEWDQFLDIVDEDGDGAQAFLESRAKLLAGPARAPSPSRPREAVESDASMLARLAAYKKFEAGLAHEIRTSDLDPARMASWTEEQWARAEFSGLLDRLEPSAWPAEARDGGEAETDGSCKLRKAYAQRNPPEADEIEDEDGEEDFAGCSVWEESDGEWRTDFPPPEGFDGDEEGEPGDEDYQRELTPAELEAIGADREALAAEEAELLAEQGAARDRYFGFDAQRAADSGGE